MEQPESCVLSIVIVNWNTRALLSACLDTVVHEMLPLQKQGIALETIVVDNASSDDSVAFVKQHYPWVTLIENDENAGFPTANNQAIRICQGQYVLLLNSDTEVRPGALSTLISFLRSQPEAGAVGAMLLNSDGSLQPSCYPAPTLARELWRMFHLDIIYPFGIYKMSGWSTDEPREVDALMGACILLRREVLDEVGLMDESYFMYSEEIDLCQRIQRGGWSLWWVPQAKVVHHGGQSTQQVASEMFLQLYRSKLQFMRKHHGALAGFLYKLILCLAAGFRLLFTPLALLSSAQKRDGVMRQAVNYQRLLFALPSL